MTDDGGMRHEVRHGRLGGVDLDAALLWAHAAATGLLAGLVWTVQVVVYPGFRAVGPESWAAVHADHTDRTTRLVVLPWAVQGVTTAALLLRRPDGVPLAMLLLTGALAASTVAVTALVQVPLHTRPARGPDAALVDRLVRTDRLRTAAWSGGLLCALLMVGLADATS